MGSSNNSGMDEVKAIITLRSGKQVDQPMPKPVEESRQGEELQPEHILQKEDSMKYCIPPPFPQALRGKKKATQQAGILEVLRQVKVNTFIGHNQTSACLCKIFERSLHNQEGIRH